MKKGELIILFCVIALTGASAAVLMRLKGNQRLGQPGIKTTPIAGSIQRQIDLPERVLDFESREIPQPAIVTNTLPADTSYGQRLYRAADGFEVLMNVVMMGSDRTSLHKPEFCLVGGGWRIDTSEHLKIPIMQPHRYDLPVVRKLVTRQHMQDGRPVTVRGVYVYWYVADGALSGDATGFERMWWLAKHLLLTGELQRWAYVTCFSVCPPGQEEATYERLKQFVAASVPMFQLTTGPAVRVSDKAVVEK